MKGLDGRIWVGLSLLASLLLPLTGCGGKGLSGGTPDERSISAAQLGKNGANENIPILVDALRHDQEMVQVQAATSLGRIGTVEAVRALEEFAGVDSRLVRQAVAQALRDVDPSAYEEAGRVLVKMGRMTMPRQPGRDPDLIVRAAVVTSLAVVKQASGVDYLIERLREDPDEGIRNAAVLTLGRLRDPRAVDVLIDVFRNDNQKNRSWAVEALGKIGDSRGRDVVLEALGDYDPVCRGKAAWALMQLDGEQAAPLLEQRLAEEDDDMPAVVIAHALALLGKQEAVPFLEDRALHARNNFARAEAIRVLGEVGRSASIPVIDKAFNDDRDGLVKREAATAIKKLMARFPPEEARAN